MSDTIEPVVKPMGLQLNKEQAALLLRGLEGLNEVDKKSVVYDALHRDLQTINAMWDRVIKNHKIIADQRRKKVMEAKQANAGGSKKS